MDLGDAVRRRRMVRSFTSDPLPDGAIEALVDLARRAPSAGHSQGWAFVSLEGADETARYWDAAMPDGDRRASFRWQGLLTAPALIVVLARPDAWVERYAEDDKAASGLGRGQSAWTVPYWWVDTGMAVEHLLLGAVAGGLGASFFGAFDHEADVLAALGVPEGWRAVGTVALGVPADDGDSGRSVARGRRAVDEVLHRGSW